MPRWYLIDEQIKTLTQSTGVTNTLQRVSDQRVAKYGNARTSAELTYLRSQNTDSAGVNTHWADAWDTFAGAQGVTTVNRPTEKRNVFFRTKNYP